MIGPAGFMAAPKQEPEQPMYVVEKPSGSYYARVVNRVTSVTIARYNVMHKNGWALADAHAERLNKGISHD